MTRLAVGCMTGTSIDSIDAALVEISGRGLDMTARFIRGASAPLGDLVPRLRRLAQQHPMTAGEIATLSRDFSLAHIPVIRDALAGARPDLICIHGQTVFHQPPISWQMLTPAVIAHAVRAPVVFDLRAADLAAGGQGAPITPIADWVLFRHWADRLALINLGGFSNYTAWSTPAQRADAADPAPQNFPDIFGGDLCVCNQLLDMLARERLGRGYDEGGRIAATGSPDAAAMAELVSLLETQRCAGRSLGTGDELASWASRHSSLPTPVILRTACEAIAESIIAGVKPEFPLLVGGGGVHNAALLDALARGCRHGVHPTDAAGVPVAYREAACFAVLGALCQDRIPISIPRITGVPDPAPIAGAWVLP